MITIKIGGSVVDDLHPSVVADIKKVVEQEEEIGRASCRERV